MSALRSLCRARTSPGPAPAGPHPQGTQLSEAKVFILFTHSYDKSPIAGSHFRAVLFCF